MIDWPLVSVIIFLPLIGALIILYFRTKITFYPIKIFIYEGMGIGFISFWIVNIALIISFLFDIEPKLIGYTLLRRRSYKILGFNQKKPYLYFDIFLLQGSVLQMKLALKKQLHFQSFVLAIKCFQPLK